MDHQIGRNQPCHCGSGRKYKNCCYRRDAQASGKRWQDTLDSEWQKMRRTEGEIVNAVGLFVRERSGEDLIGRAWQEFSAGSTIPREQLEESIFIPWFIFNWLPPAARGWFQARQEPQPLALDFLATRGAGLDDYQKFFIREACGQPFSFFLVTGVEPRQSLTLRDLLLEREVTVKERQASEILKRGHVIFARCVSLASQSILLGVGPIPLPPEIQASVLDLRDDLKKTSRMQGRLDPEFLSAGDRELRRFYFEAAERVLNPPLPVLQNTDGDPLVMIGLKYELRCAPELAVEELKTLVLPEYREEILDEAEFDGSGSLAHVVITWQKRGNRQNPEWDNTSLGQIEIRPGTLEIEVNSEKRAEIIRREILSRLGDRCQFVREERRSAEELFRGEKDPGRRGKGRRSGATGIPEMSPELREVLKEQMKAHWDAWLDSPLPALKGQTPRKAARTPEGRERLEALLLEFEYRNESAIQPELRPDVAELRRILQLPSRR